VACELDFLTGIQVPAGDILTNQEMGVPFTARRVVLGGSGPAFGNAKLIQRGGGLALVANGSGTPALHLSATGALGHRLEMPVSLAANLNVSGDGGAGFEIVGGLSGAAGLVKTGSSTLALGANNSYSGHTNIQQGAIRVGHANGLGSTASGTTVQGGSSRASLEVMGDVAVAEAIQLVMHNNADHTQLRNISGHNTLSGQLSLNSGGSRWDIAALAGSLTLTGPVVNISAGTDTWRTLYLHGPGAGTLSGNLSNSTSGNSLTNLRVVSGSWTLASTAKTYTGNTHVEGGSLTVEAALSSDLSVGANATLGGSGSTTGSLALANSARLLCRITDWNAPPAPFTAARLTLTGANAISISVDATALANFSETPQSFAVVATSVPSVPGSTVFTPQVENFAGHGTWSASLSGHELRLGYQPDLFAAWSAGIDWRGADSSPLGDSESDGVSNLLEYALGGDPLASDPGILPRPSLSNGRMAITFHRTADPDLIYQVEAADELAGPGWVPVWSSTGAANTSGPVTVEDTQHANASPRRFMRLRVSR
jgi:autotransporter-associated beta strand protein